MPKASRLASPTDGRVAFHIHPMAFPYVGNRHLGTFSFSSLLIEISYRRRRVLHEMD